MDEKQRLMEAEAAQMAAVETTPPPPAYADVEVSVETIEVLTEAPTVPGWIKRLPLTLPLAHFMFSVPLSLFFARSFAGAVFVCSAVSFWLVASATAGIARATRHDIRLQKAGVRYLGGAGILMVSWPFLIVMIFAPSHMPYCRAKMHHAHHHGPHTVTGRPFYLHHHNAPVALPSHHHHVGTVSSSKGDRIVLAAVGEKLAQMKEYFPNLKTASVRVVVSSKGVKALVTEEESINVAPAPVEDAHVHDAPVQDTPALTENNEDELR